MHPRCIKTHRRAMPLALLVCIASAPAATAARTDPPSSAAPSASNPVAAHVAEASRRFGIPEHWIRAVMRAESNGDPGATSHAGAMGLMQIMPTTWSELRARHRLGRDPYHPRDNILAGAAYLRELYERYGNVSAMLAAYNAGPGRYDNHLATGRPLPRETRLYLARLVPMVGGAPAGPLARPTADVLAWTHAPLFLRPHDRAVDMPSSAALETPGEDAPATRELDDEALLDRLFVPLSGQEPS